MAQSTFSYSVPAAPPHWRDEDNLTRLSWDDIPALPPFQRHDGSGPAIYQTEVRLCADRQALYLHYDCQDIDIWGTYTERDQPIYDEEVVELFLAPGPDVPTRYYEFEVSPNGVLFDAKIHNPNPGQAKIEIFTEWDCPGIQWHAERHDEADRWTVALVIPWAADSPPGPLPSLWRANFYRIERPRGAEPEFSCWSPTLAQPANFHIPSRFGLLHLPFTEQLP